MTTNRSSLVSMENRRIKQPVVFLCLMAIIVLFSYGCATVGQEFSVNNVPEIQIGKTTQKEISHMFGAPWRVGIEDGNRTWNYGRYNYSIIKANRAKDLVIRFDAKGIVTSYTFTTTEHDNELD